MTLLGILHAVMAVPILLACLGGAAMAADAAWAWRYDRRRFLIVGWGALGALGAAGLVGAVLFGGTAQAGMNAWLTLVPAAVLPVLLVTLLRALGQQDRVARLAADTAPANRATGLPNRPVLIAQMLPVLARCRREKAPASIIALRGDGLEEIEAQRGRAAADEVLRDMGTALRDTVRAADVPGHLGPAVIGALLPGTPAESADILAARLSAAVAARVAHPAMDGRRFAVSIGIAAVGDGEGRAVLEEAIAAAVAASAAAQAAGGNARRRAEAPPPRSAAVQAASGRDEELAPR